MFNVKSKWKSPKITNADLLLFFVKFVFIDLVILTAWTALDPTKATTVRTAYQDAAVEQTVCKSGEDTFFAVTLFYKICLMGIGLYFSWHIRHLHADFSDSKYIFLGVSYICVVGGAVLVLVR